MVTRIKQSLSLMTAAMVVSIGLTTGLVMTSGMAQAACSPPATTYGSDTVTLNVPSSGSYALWVRMQAPSTTSNQLMLQVNGGSCFNVGGSAAIPLNTWTWVNYQNGSTSQVMQAQLAAGNNSLLLIGTQPKVVVDTVLALASTSCVPTGLGTNCTSQQSSPTGGGSTPGTTVAANSAQAIADSHLPAVALSAGGSVLTPNGTSVQLSKTVTVSPVIIPGKTIKEAKYYLNNHLVYTATKSPYAYKINPDRLIAGTYDLTMTTVYTTGETANTSEKIVIVHPWYTNTAIVMMDYWWAIVLGIGLIGFSLWWVVFRRRPSKSSHDRLIAPTPTTPPDTIVQPGVYPTEEKTDL